MLNSIGKVDRYVSEATIFTIEEAKEVAKVAQEAVKKDVKAMQDVVVYGYSSPFINIPDFGKMVSTTAAESYARSHGNPIPVSSKL